jgi:hypothetical protein
MRTTRTLLLPLLSLLLCSVPALAHAQASSDSSESNSKPAPVARKMAGPPPELKKLQILIGTWTSKAHTEAGPSGQATDYTGLTKFAWAFDGMHVEGEHTYRMGGKPEKGRSTWGWDPERKQYQVIWTSTAFPASYVYYGTFPDDTTAVLFGTYMVSGRAVTDKMTYTFRGKDEYTFVVESDAGGTMEKTAEETGRREGGAAEPAKKPVAKAATPKKSAGGASKN